MTKMPLFKRNIPFRKYVVCIHCDHVVEESISDSTATLLDCCPSCGGGFSREGILHPKYIGYKLEVLRYERIGLISGVWIDVTGGRKYD